MQQIAITGSNRGIGLELVRQFAARGETQIFAMCRQPAGAAELNALSRASGGRIQVIALEVTDSPSIRTAVQEVAKLTDHIDLLINNAAINPPGRSQTIEKITSETMLQVLHVNTVAPLLIVQAFLDLLKKGSLPKIVNVSSEMGSLNDRDYGGYYGYCTSKAALNMVTRGLAADLAEYGIVTVSLDPGWVQTDMGGEDADLAPAEAVKGILRVIDTLTRKDNGTYLRWNGRTLAW